jgi:uncharacterized LabA/DUF88 family protein
VSAKLPPLPHLQVNIPDPLQHEGLLSIALGLLAERTELAGGILMTSGGEVAVFLDFENIRYSLLNKFQQEPNILALIEKARKYGSIAVAWAYADFNEHPEWVRRQLDVAGIGVRDVPLRRSYRNGIERVKSSADLHMVMDMIETVLDRPHVHTYVLMAGDSDYIRVTTWLRNRFNKRVIVCGVPGAISRDLVVAAGNEDTVEVREEPQASLEEVMTAMIDMIREGKPPLGFWTLPLITRWAQDSRNHIPGSEAQKSESVKQMLLEGVLFQREEVRGDRLLKVTYLDVEHWRVQTLASLSSLGQLEAGIRAEE